MPALSGPLRQYAAAGALEGCAAGCYVQPMNVRSYARALAVGLLVSALGGCGGDADASAGATFSAEPQQVLTSDQGRLHIEIRSAPHPAVRGVNRFRLYLTDPAGAPADGLAIAVQPWMPAHGHGTSVVPQTMALGPGQYEIDQVYFYMAGDWQLRMTFSAAETDSAAPSFDIR